MIVEIVSDSEMFFDTKREYEHFINAPEIFVDRSKTPLNNFNEVYRIVHTFKGAFSQLYMQRIVTFLHELESHLSLMTQANKMTNESLVSILDDSDFRTSWEKELEIIATILGDEFLKESNYIKVNFDYLHELQEKVERILDQGDQNLVKYQDLFNKILNLSKIKVMNLLKPYNNLVNQLAQRLGKEIYPFEIIGDSDITVTEECKPFIKSLVHVFRNSIDHGIEDAETRVENNKDEKGTISCSFEKRGDSLQIVISDDGAGINKDKILAKAIEKGIINQNQAHILNEEEIYHFIFSDQFSTKDEVTEISGRGGRNECGQSGA